MPYYNYSYPYNQYVNPQMQTPVQPQYPAQQNQVTHVIWVQGSQAALSYQLAPLEKVFFMDCEEPVLYVREADQTGKPLPMETYDLVKHENAEAAPVDMSQYMKRSDIEQMIQEEINKRMPKTRRKSEE